MPPRVLKTSPQSFKELMEQNYRLWCPLYQRPYVWTRKLIDNLFHDAETVDDEEYKSRFLGALVFEPEDAEIGAPARYWVIDGQQRLTTLYILLLVVANELHERGEEERAKNLVENYLVLRSIDGPCEPKFRPTVLDTRQFNGLLSGISNVDVQFIAGAQGEDNGRMKAAASRARRLIRDRVAGLEETAATEWLWRFADCLLTGMRFVTITLGDDHDADEVFDRLNTAAVTLRTLDLVRNEVMKVTSGSLEQAQHIYDQHWIPFQEKFGEDDSRAERYFYPLGLTRDSSIAKPETFDLLSTRWKTMRASAENKAPSNLVKIVMEDLTEHQEAFIAFMHDGSLGLWRSGISGDDRKMVNQRVSRLRRLNCPVVTMPYLMPLLTGIMKEEIEVANGLELLDVVEAFLVRRARTGREPTGLHAVFRGLWKPDDLRVGALVARLETSTIVFPEDQEFGEWIRTDALYGRDIRHFILWERELSYEGDQHGLNQPQFDASHIIPRNLAPEDLRRYGNWAVDEWAALKDTWANLIPLRDVNLMMARTPWTEARGMVLQKANFHTARDVAKRFQTWNPSDLERRAEELVEWAVGRWSKPEKIDLADD